MDDLLDLLDSDEKPFKAREENNNSVKKQNGVNLWEKTDFKAIKIDVGSLRKTGRSFSVGYHIDKDHLPEEVEEKFLEIAKILGAKGYTFRHNGNVDDRLQNAILKIEDLKVESYLPWKKFNIDIKKPVITSPSEKGYGIAFNSHKVFTKLPPAIRAILANQVHTLLGKECNDPVNLLIGYSSCGSEAIVKDMDYKKSGNLTFFLKVCGDANIPVFNLKSDTAIKRLAEFIKTNS